MHELFAGILTLFAGILTLLTGKIICRNSKNYLQEIVIYRNLIICRKIFFFEIMKTNENKCGCKKKQTACLYIMHWMKRGLSYIFLLRMKRIIFSRKNFKYIFFFQIWILQENVHAKYKKLFFFGEKFVRKTIFERDKKKSSCHTRFIIFFLFEYCMERYL